MATQWRPDTCSCVLEYNDNLQFVATVSVCSKHAALARSSAHFDEVLKHNRRKNEVVSSLVKNGVDADKIAVGYSPNAPVDNDPVLVFAEDPAIEAKVSLVFAEMPIKGNEVRPVLKTFVDLATEKVLQETVPLDGKKDGL